MPIVMADATKNSIDITIKMIYGSVEKMQKHPNWVLCNKRFTYLKTMALLIEKSIQEDIDNIHPFNLWQRLVIAPIAKKAGRSITDRIRQLASRYETQLLCPVSGLVRTLEGKYWRLIDDNINVIHLAHKRYGKEIDSHV